MIAMFTQGWFMSDTVTLPDVACRYLNKRDRFMLTEDYVTPEVIVPKGLITDGGTIPRILWSLFPPYYRYFPACIVHDYLYLLAVRGIGTKEEADTLFKLNIQRCGLGMKYWLPMYAFVKLFGRPDLESRSALPDDLVLYPSMLNKPA